MATVKGRTRVKEYIARTPKQVANVLRGAGRVAANVVAEEARHRSVSSEVSGAIKVSVKAEGSIITARVLVKGKGAYLAPWLEYGTSPHFISVDDSQRRGMSIGKLNKLAKEPDSNHSLVIGGNFVGKTVLHPGARPYPFLRPALDVKAGDAVAAAQKYINSHIGPAGITEGADK